MVRKSSILWTLAFAIYSLAQTTSSDETTSTVTPTSTASSLSDFAATVEATPVISTSEMVTPSTLNDTTQLNSNDPSTGSMVDTTTDTTTEPDNTLTTNEAPSADSVDSTEQNPDSTDQDLLVSSNSSNDAGNSTLSDEAVSSGNATDQNPDSTDQGPLGNVGQNSTADNSTMLNSTNDTDTVQDLSDYPGAQVINASTPLPQSVIANMSSRAMRYHHYLWHQVREGWNRFTPEAQLTYTNLGWAPPRPARNYDANGVASAIPDNDSGQDFLYMHRDMINRFNAIIAANNESYGNITGWKTLPAPGDPDWPVPPNYTIPNNTQTTNLTTTQKSDDFYITIQKAEKSFKDPVQLRNMTLGELGARIEVTIHSWLHLRFSSENPIGIRNVYINKNNLPFINSTWDDPAYNWLADTYASHLNPTFYKIHGWIDDRIGDWQTANNVTNLVWNGTWTGGPWANVEPILMAKKSMSFRGSTDQSTQMSSMDHSGNNIEVLEQALTLFLSSGVPESTFTDEVKLDWAPWNDVVEPEQSSNETTETP